MFVNYMYGLYLQCQRLTTPTRGDKCAHTYCIFYLKTDHSFAYNYNSQFKLHSNLLLILNISINAIEQMKIPTAVNQFLQVIHLFFFIIRLRIYYIF